MRIAHRAYNLTLTNANEEYSQSVSPFAKYISIVSRNPICDLKMSFTQGLVDTGPYTTIFAPSRWSSPELASIPDGRTIYLSGNEAGTVVEIEEWT